MISVVIVWKDMDDERFIVMLLVEYVSSKMLKKKEEKEISLGKTVFTRKREKEYVSTN